MTMSAARVTSAEPHPNADKLLVMKVEMGEEERQLVAGIRGHYEPDELVGKTLIVVANLQPAKLRGVESQGMLLAVSDGDRVVALTTDSPTATGLRVT